MNDAGLQEQTAVQSYDLPPSAAPELVRDVERFLHYEAHLLDNYDLLSWLKLITQDIDYRMPIRTTIDDMNLSLAFSDRAFHMIEDYGSLKARMERLVSGAAWSEKPPSRVRRHISNIRVAPEDQGNVEVLSNLMFFWARDDQQFILSGERSDVMHVVEGRLYLAQRVVFLDHDTIPIPNLSVIF